MRRAFVLIAPLAAALAACSPPAPYETGGVGFGTYDDYRARQDAALAASARPVTPYPGAPYGGTAVASAPADPNAPITNDTLAAAGIGAASATGAPMTATGAATATAAAPAPSHSGISDEQDFSAVASRETIESDKARMEQNRAQYQQIAPGELPQRSGGSTVSPIIEYAIAAPNSLGQPIYKRGGLSLSSSQKACQRYPTPAEAQEAFLKSGGPNRDPKNLDPDGDGFACAWDPTPFQAARDAQSATPAPAVPPASGQGG